MEIYKIINLKYSTMTKKFKLKIARIFFFLKKSNKIIPNNNDAICLRNISEQPSYMYFHFPCCLVFWEVLNICWMMLQLYLLFWMATLYVYTITCIHSKFLKIDTCLFCLFLVWAFCQVYLLFNICVLFKRVAVVQEYIELLFCRI